ncbi:protein-disulfide reductase DsbD domain-containing protein, partial [Bombella apis]
MARHIGRMMMAVFAMVSGMVFLASPVRAAESTPVVTSHTTATLVSAVDAVGQEESQAEGGTLRVGLRLQLKPGWHTYWQNPGDAGEAPHVHVMVSGSRSGGTDTVAWPVPERIPEGGLMAYAYQGDVLLPVR